MKRPSWFDRVRTIDMLLRCINAHPTEPIAEIVLCTLFRFGDFDGGICLDYDDIECVLQAAAAFRDHRLFEALRDNVANAGPPF